MAANRAVRRPTPAAIQYDDSAFVGEIRPNAGSTVPNGWLQCDGQILATTAYPDLFAVIGTRFGGDGVTTFNLPDLRGRTPIGAGQGSALTNRNLGDSGGVESETLTIGEMPAHAHNFRASAMNGVSDTPSGRVFGRDPSAMPEFGTVADAGLGSGAVASSGGGQAHNTMQPFLTIMFIIAYQGMAPTP